MAGRVEAERAVVRPWLLRSGLLEGEPDVHVPPDGIGDGAPLLRVASRILEAGLVQSGNDAPNDDVHPRDREAFTLLLEGAGGRHVQAVRRCPLLGQST